jgi:hypothetical protein
MANAFSAQDTTSLQTAFDVLKPQLMNTLFKKYDDEYLPFFLIVNTLGEVKPVAGGTFGHYEIGWIHRAFTVNSHAAGAAGASVTLTVTNNSSNITQSNMYPQVRDVVRFASGISATVTAVSTADPYTVTVVPVVSTEAIPAVSTGDTIIITGTNFVEGSTAATGRVNPALKYTFNTQIIKQAVDITGSAMTNETWYDKFSDGKSALPYPKLQLECEYRMLQNISYEMLFSVATDSTQQAITGSTTMTGIFPWAEAGGNKIAIAPQTFTVSHFDQLNRVFDKRRASGEYLWAAGSEQYRDVENGLADLFTQNPNILAQTGFESRFKIGDGTDYGTKYGVSFNFKAVQKTGRTFYFTTIPQMSGEQLGGAPGFTDANKAVIIPLGKGTDAKSGAKINRLAYRYKEYGGVSRMMKVTQHGIWAPTANDEFDHAKYNALHEGGNELTGVETWGCIVAA